MCRTKNVMPTQNTQVYALNLSLNFLPSTKVRDILPHIPKEMLSYVLSLAYILHRISMIYIKPIVQNENIRE